MGKSPYDTAYEKGIAAGKKAVETGESQPCPYIDRRKDSGKLTWSRAFIRAWGAGFDIGYFEAKKAK